MVGTGCWHVLMKDGYAAERAARPLRKIRFELWMQCLNERPGERYLESRTYDGTFPVEVHD
jgi:hypothetical protein